MDEKHIHQNPSKLDVNSTHTDPRSWTNFKDKKPKEYFTAYQNKIAQTNGKKNLKDNQI